MLAISLKDEREKWRKEKINIAVIGQARQGKSSLINANVGKKVAKVRATGVCTTDIRSFPHPRNPNIILWDVPGVDAVKFPREAYFEKIGYYKNDYDFFLIVTKDIFSSDAKYVADEVQKNNKRFYLIRTHIDDSIEKQMKDKDDDESLEEEDIVADVRKNVKTELETFAFDTSKFKVYLVNNRNPLEYDFPKLKEDICRDSVSELQQEALLLTIGGYGREMIELKYKLFQSRIKKAAIASAAGGAVPIPGISATIDLTILIEETLTYFEGFGLSKESIESLEELNEVPKGTIEDALTNKLYNENRLLYVVRHGAPRALSSWDSVRSASLAIASTSGRFIASQLSLLATSETVETTVKWVLPFVGSAVAAGISYAVTSYQLGCFLDQMKKLAVFANSYLSDAERHRLEAFEASEDEN